MLKKTKLRHNEYYDTQKKCMTIYTRTVLTVTISFNWKRWNAVCPETGAYGVKWGKSWR